VPGSIRGSQPWLVSADASLTWTRWYIDGMADSRRYIVDEQLTYPHLYVEVRDRLRYDNPGLPADELQVAATAVSELAWSEISRRRTVRREVIPQALKEQLWFSAEPTPRCYLCGYAFGAVARDRLLDRLSSPGLSEVDLPLLVDFTRPRGRVARDLGIEIDHVRPASTGGETSEANLRLACGWCNRVKSAHGLLYDASATPASTISTPQLGSVAVPQPLWVLRTVATRGRCEHPSGCAARLRDHELFVAPRNPRGGLNPVNSLVYCDEHDPWATARFVARADAQLSR
jgi:hypothetical protein